MENDLISIGNARTLRLDGRRIGVGMRRGVGALSCGRWLHGRVGCVEEMVLARWMGGWPMASWCVGRVAQLEGCRLEVNWRGFGGSRERVLPAFGMRVLRFERWIARWAFGVKNYAKWLTSRASRPVRDIFLRACLGA